MVQQVSQKPVHYLGCYLFFVFLVSYSCNYQLFIFIIPKFDMKTVQSMIAVKEAEQFCNPYKLFPANYFIIYHDS